jgi:hypothetical protein
MRHRELVEQTKDFKTTVNWMIESGYLHNQQPCEYGDGRLMNLIINNDRARFKCGKCSSSNRFLLTQFYTT